MPRRVREAKVNNRTNRLALASRPKPYFRLLSDGLHLGYYRSAVRDRAGAWIARRYVGGERYATITLGRADDVAGVPADGVNILTFEEAGGAARKWAKAEAAKERDAAKPASAAVTVASAIAAYIASRIRDAARSGRDAELRLTHHVLSAPIATLELGKLTDEHFSEWRAGLSRGGRRKRGDPMAPATVARLFADFRAALNAAARAAKVPVDVLATIRAGLQKPKGTDVARPKQVLPDADVRRIVEAALGLDDDFGALVMVLAATGARLDQAARITVADLQLEQQRVMVPVSRKGRGEKQVTHHAVPLPPDVLARLRTLAAGRPGHEALLLHWHHAQVKGEKAAGTLPAWERVDRRPWRGDATITRRWRGAVKVAGLSASLVPYSLRHSSIVRGLRAGLPVRLVAAMHDTSAAMVERHYSAFIVDAAEDLLRRAVVPLAPATVAPLRAVG